MSSSHPVLKYLSNTLDRACATMVGSSLAGFCCVTTAAKLGFDAKVGLPVSILLASLNMSLIYRTSDVDRSDENVPLACRIAGMIIGLCVPVFFWLLGVYAACMTVKS